MAYSQELIVPDAVKIEISGRNIKVNGPKGELEKRFGFRENIKIAKVENKVKVTTESDRKKTKAIVGTIRAHIENLITGVTEGFTYKLRAVYAHFPITIKIEGKQVVVQNFLGARTPRVAKIIEGVDVKIDKTDLTVSGIDLEKVSQTAANIEQSCRIVGFDKKRFMDGVYITSKGDE